MQRSCYPFVADGDSALTPAGISKVRFGPFSGCWPNQTYYYSSDGTRQTDGYGRTTSRKGLQKLNPKTGEIRRGKSGIQPVSHRAIWAATGGILEDRKVLNHLCSNRRCCNPDHLEQVSSGENNRHGLRAQTAIEKAGASSPTSARDYLSPRQLAPYWDDANRLYSQICTEQGLQV